MISLDLPSEADTEALGARLAASLPSKPPLRALRVFLRGELGAGKTTLVRGLLRALGETGSVRSPTYALLQGYALQGWQITHADLYRLGSAEQVFELGFADLDTPRSLWLIEWPERARGVLGEADLDIELEVSAQGHRAVLSARTEAGRHWLILCEGL